MNTYLLVWNPKKWKWVDLEERKRELMEKGHASLDWSCGNNKSIQLHDRVFIIRLGEEPKGIFASGIVEDIRHDKQHWDKAENRQIGFITARLDTLLNPGTDPILPLGFLKKGMLGKMHWESQASGIQIPDIIADKVEKEFKTIKKFSLFE